MDGVTRGSVALAFDAWSTVGAFVVLSLLVVHLVGARLDRDRARSLASRPYGAPVGGALLGAVPGCGGAIAVVSLYGHGTVGFGTLVAALVATAGDSAFVLLAAAPRTAAVVYGIALVAAVAAGVTLSVTDARRRLDRFGRGSTTATAPDGGTAFSGPPAATTSGRSSRGVPAAGVVLGGWWLAALVGVVVGLDRAVTGTAPAPVAGGSVTLPALAAVLGVGLSAVLHTVPDEWVRPLRGSSWRVGVATAVEASRVVLWVVLGLGAFRLATATGVIGAAVPAVGQGVTGAVGGAVLGAVPGCGVHVALVTAHTEGAVSCAALVANAGSQDGDALFALFAVDRLAAVVATAYTTLVAVVVGLVVVAL